MKKEEFRQIIRECIQEVNNENMMRYFSIGHGSDDYVWIWVNGELKYERGGSHSINFDRNELNQSTFKGRFETSSDTVTAIGTNGNKGPVPPELDNALKQTFHYKKLETF